MRPGELRPGKIVIEVDHPDLPSAKIDDEPAWRAVLWASPAGSSAIEISSRGGPGQAVNMAISILSRRPKR